MKTEFILKE